MEVTSRQIMDATGIQNIKTLSRWHQKGLIPPPTMGVHPDGNGRMAYWPGWVLEHCKVIKQLTDEGRTVNEIHALFGSNFEAIGSRYRKYNFAGAMKASELAAERREIAREIDSTITSRFAQIRRGLEATSFPSVAFDIVGQALDIIEQGQNPILIVSPERTLAVPDFLLSLQLSNHYEDQTALLVVPLFPILARFGLIRTTRKKPRVKPSTTVVSHGKKKQLDQVRVKPNWEYEILPEADS